MKKTSTVQTFSNEIFKEQDDAHFSGGPVFGYSIRLNPIPFGQGGVFRERVRWLAELGRG